MGEEENYYAEAKDAIRLLYSAIGGMELPTEDQIFRYLEKIEELIEY